MQNVPRPPRNTKTSVNEGRATGREIPRREPEIAPAVRRSERPDPLLFPDQTEAVRFVELL